MPSSGLGHGGPIDKSWIRLFLAATITASAGCSGACGASREEGAGVPSAPAGEQSASEESAALDETERSDKAAELMMRFAERTGLSSKSPSRRYLWTDAFAVCNFLGLARARQDARYMALALELVDRVHHTLGKHRPDEARKGWLSGLVGEEAESHPTRGGLRIGKPLPERTATDPFDEALEWDRDGQYFHYITKWMHALDQASRATAKPPFNLWARELAHAAHAFVYTPAGRERRMYWKMSIDLKRPLVTSMGQHDALDGYVSCLELRSTTALLGANGAAELDGMIADFAGMTNSRSVETADPLGLGGLMADAHRLEQLAREGARIDERLVTTLLQAARSGLERYARQGELSEPAERRLAFRDLGLAIGLEAIALMRHEGAGQSGRKRDAETSALLERLARYDSLRARIIAFWLEPAHRRATTWTEHLDINEVMLATALVPEGFLVRRQNQSFGE